MSKNLNNSLLKKYALVRCTKYTSIVALWIYILRDVRACKPLFRVQAASLRNVRACRPRFHMYAVSLPAAVYHSRNTCTLDSHVKTETPTHV